MNDECGPKAALEVPTPVKTGVSIQEGRDDRGELLGVVEVGTGCEYCDALTNMVLCRCSTDLSLHQHWACLVYHEPGCWPAAFADDLRERLSFVGCYPAADTVLC